MHFGIFDLLRGKTSLWRTISQFLYLILDGVGQTNNARSRGINQVVEYIIYYGTGMLISMIQMWTQMVNVDVNDSNVDEKDSTFYTKDSNYDVNDSNLDVNNILDNLELDILDFHNILDILNP